MGTPFLRRGNFAFDEDTSISPGGEVTLTDRWNGMAGQVNGGYELAICTKALSQIMPFPDPLVVSGLYLRPGTPGPATVRASVLRAGKTMAFGEASLWREGKELVRATGAFGNLNPVDPNGLLFLGTARPELPPPDETIGFAHGMGQITIADRFDYRGAELPGWLRGQPSGNPSLEFWMRFADGRDADLTAVPLLVDAAAPVILELGAVSTTVELTVHLRARPAPAHGPAGGWLACRATTRFVSGGYHEEDFEIWDSTGTLVAQSRQLCMILR